MNNANEETLHANVRDKINVLKCAVKFPYFFLSRYSLGDTPFRREKNLLNEGRSAK